jgi:hypothetical protein
MASAGGWWLLTRAGSPDQTAGAWSIYPEPEDWPGVEWTTAPLPVRERGPWTSVSGMGTVGTSVAAWGLAAGPDAPNQVESSQLAMLWLTNDGVSWEQIHISVAGREQFSPSRVVLGPWGYLAAGSVDKGEWPNLAGSADGFGWADVPAPTTRFNLLGLLGTRDAYWLAAITDTGWNTWRTTDGQQWTAHPLPDAARNLQFGALTDSGEGVLIAGWTTTSNTVDPALWRWTEADGWTALGVPARKRTTAGEGAAVQRVVAFAGGLFATGWAGPDPACTSSGIRLASASMDGTDLAGTDEKCGWMAPAAWVSADGKTWREVDLAGTFRVPLVAMPAVRAGGRGLIALVTENEVGGVPSIGLWTSADGAAWERVGDGPIVDRGGYVSFEDVGVIAGHVILFGGNARGDAVTWTGVPAR